MWKAIKSNGKLESVAKCPMNEYVCWLLDGKDGQVTAQDLLDVRQLICDGTVVTHHMAIVATTDSELLSPGRWEGQFTKVGCAGHNVKASPVECHFAVQYGMHDEFGISFDNPAIVDVSPLFLTNEKLRRHDQMAKKDYSIGLCQCILLNKDRFRIIPGYTYAGNYSFPTTSGKREIMKWAAKGYNVGK